ncbi:MAG: MFS transporter, partial [Mesorhizobium sp.]
IWGWRATFWVMGALGVAATLAMAALLPRATGYQAKSASLASEVRVLARQQVWTSLILMLMLMLGQFCLFTYITPTLLEVTGLDENLVPWVLLLNGVGATLGVFLGGKLSDWKLMPSLITMLALQAVTLAIIYLVSPYPLPMVVAIIVWGGLNFAIGTPIQTRILAWTADASGLAASLIPSGFNIGIALAASLGAAMLNAGYGYRSLPVVGAFAMAVAVIVAVISHLWERRSDISPPVPVAAE